MSGSLLRLAWQHPSDPRQIFEENLNRGSIRVVAGEALANPEADEYADEEVVSGGGGGVPPGIGERVAVLERQAAETHDRLGRMEAILGRLQEHLTALVAKAEDLPGRREMGVLSQTLGEVKVRLDEMPIRREFGGQAELLAGMRSKVDSLPTWLQIIGMAGFISALAIGLGNLDRIIRAIREPVSAAASARSGPADTGNPVAPSPSAGGKPPS